jgi:hypothetical protein
VTQLNRNLNALLSYSRFYAVSFIEDTGPSKTVHFLGAELQLRILSEPCTDDYALLVTS